MQNPTFCTFLVCEVITEVLCKYKARNVQNRLCHLHARMYKQISKCICLGYRSSISLVM